jgi:hypothetical protein
VWDHGDVMKRRAASFRKRGICWQLRQRKKEEGEQARKGMANTVK